MPAIMVMSGAVRVSLTVVRIDHGDRACAGRLGRVVDQRRHAAGHRVALDVAVAPAGDVAGHVIGGEVVAVRPLDARADLQGVFGRVVVGGPAFQQHAAERAVVVVLDQVFEPAAVEVRDLRPVGEARVLHAPWFPCHAQRAARRAFLGLCLRVQPGPAGHRLRRPRPRAPTSGSGIRGGTVCPAPLPRHT